MYFIHRTVVFTSFNILYIKFDNLIVQGDGNLTKISPSYSILGVLDPLDPKCHQNKQNTIIQTLNV